MKELAIVTQITDSYVRVLVGNIVNGKPVVACTKDVPIKGAVSRGDILDYQSLLQVMRSLNQVVDDNIKLRVNMNHCHILLPSIGFNIFQSRKESTCCSATGHLQKIDFQNVINQIKNQNVPQGSQIVDIIPTSFILDGNQRVATPPEGQISRSIGIEAMVHTLAYQTVNHYTKILEDANIKCQRAIVTPYALCEFAKHVEGIPAYHVLVDIQDGYTSITLVAGHTPYMHTVLTLGFNDLILKVAQEFRISEQTAREIIKVNGISKRELAFDPIIKVENEEFATKITPKELNRVIGDFLDNFLNQMKHNYDVLTKQYSSNPKVRTLPFVFNGEMSQISGFKNYAKEKFDQASEIHYLVPNVIGARDTKYSALIGALYEASVYKGSFNDQKMVVTPIEKTEENKK